MDRKNIERRLVREVRRRGGIVYKFVAPSNNGVPDRLVIIPGGRVDFIELKRPGGRASKLQLKQHDRIRAVGANVYILSTNEEVDRYVCDAFRTS